MNFAAAWLHERPSDDRGLCVDFTVKVEAAGDARLLYLVISLVNNACEVLRAHCSKLPAGDTAVFGYEELQIPGTAANTSRHAKKYVVLSVYSWL